MSKLIFAILFLAVCAPLISAQDETPRTEFFIGYSNLQAESGFDSDDLDDDEFFGEIIDNRTGLHGFNASITGYFTRRVGLAGDFSYNTKSQSETFSGIDLCPSPPCSPIPNGTVNTRANVFNFLAGPQVKFTNSSRVEPFVRALAGVAHTRARVRTTGLGGDFDTEFSDNSTNFALGLGGGLDVSLKSSQNS